jgi:mono/diheme cytochrome c family protein
MMKTILFGVSVCIMLLLGTAAGVAQTPAEGNPQNGKALFIKHGCARCHGSEGQGGAGARIGSKPPATAALIRYVRNPSGGMPPYRNQVTDAELTDIHAYLASIPPPPAVKDIPLLNQ